MDNSYFIAFFIVLLVAFIFIAYLNKNYLQTHLLNTEDELLEKRGSLELTTNIDNGNLNQVV
jgi:hypothetical protein